MLLVSACQVISPDDIYLPMPSSEPVSSALLVEFTGFKCVNCPNAATLATQLHEQYEDHLVVVAMHPATNKFCETNVDEYNLTCPEADTYYQHLGGSSTTPFPTGVINMNAPFAGMDQWATLVYKATHTPTNVEISLSAVTDATDCQINYSISSSQQAELKLLLWLVEDSIVGPQKMPDNSTNMEYVHNHVLRASLNGDWGEQVVVSGTTMSDVRVCALPTEIHGRVIRRQHCSVVAVVMLDDSVVATAQTAIVEKKE